MDHHLPVSLFDNLAARVQPMAATAATPAAKTAPAQPQTSQVKAGHAVKLRATQMSVLRIAHGRVWATLTDVGKYAGGNTRVLAGDHFLSRGDSLTLLPGQEVVFEPFGIGHAAPAQFSWQGLSGESLALSTKSAAAVSEWRSGVVQPLRDLRHALGLVGGASGRLLQGLGHGVVAAVKLPLTGFAMLFVANHARKMGATGLFDAKNDQNPFSRAAQTASGGRGAVVAAAGVACGKTQGCSA